MPAARLVAMRLAKAGYGTPEQLLQMPADITLDAYRYQLFTESYEETMIELNKEAEK